MTTNIHFHSHACVTLSVNSGTVLCDPWLFGRVFNEGWALQPEPDIEAIPWKKIRWIWISHEHPDHLHFPSLRAIKERVSDTTKVLFRQQANKNVVEAIRGLGFEVSEITDQCPTRLDEDLLVTSFEAGADTALLLETPDRVVFNQNDCKLSRRELKRVRQSVERIDLWLYQFSLAGWSWGLDEEKLRCARAEHLLQVEAAYATLTPSMLVPFASFMYFCCKENCYLNEYRVSVEELTENLADIPVQVCQPGDEVLWREWSERNKSRIEYWKSRRENGEVYESDTPTDEEIQIAAEKLLAQSSCIGPHWAAPDEMLFELSGRTTVFGLDFRNRRTRILSEGDGVVVGCVAPSALLAFCRFPWGADTLNISALGQMYEPARWWWLLYFRHACYRFSHTKGLKRVFLRAFGGLAVRAAAQLRVIRQSSRSRSVRLRRRFPNLWTNRTAK
jgi:hypothetical protein